MADHPSSSASRRAVAPRDETVSREPGAGRGSVVAVYGSRGDVGVTTIASSLAVGFLVLSDGRVALAEFDPRSVRARIEAGRVNHVAPSPRASRSNGDEPVVEEHVMIPGTNAGLARRSDGVWTIAPSRQTPSLTDAKSVTLALEVMRVQFAVSVAELEHQVNERTLAAFDAADRIVMVTEGSVPSLRGTQRVLRLCHRLNYPDEKMSVVVNRYDAAGTIPVADISTILKREIFWRIPTGEPVDLAGLAEKLNS
jgi:pilus assembly protein CpaE